MALFNMAYRSVAGARACTLIVLVCLAYSSIGSTAQQLPAFRPFAISALTPTPSLFSTLPDLSNSTSSGSFDTVNETSQVHIVNNLPAYSGFIKVRNGSFVDQDCKQFVFTGWNTWAMLENAAGFLDGGKAYVTEQFDEAVKYNFQASYVPVNASRVVALRSLLHA